ncbi:ABC transporter permease [Chitinophaga solisilvae]|uniref:ABC transporter permease n=1 Tax=Chitinophaga solisilvae TaxID=1233460 RepID=UPI001370A7BA|nr:ABC transporter permease [Chitinophaga solisilvae]
MLKSYLKIAWRNLLKQKVFAFVNVIGMSVAITAALLLTMTAYREWTFDSFQENKEHVYQIYREDYLAKGTAIGGSMAEPLADVIRKEVPGVKYATRIAGMEMPVRYGGKNIYFDVEMVDADYLKMFSFPVLKGNAAEALKQLNNIVVSENAAKKLFKEEEPIGKTIEVNIANKWHPFMVSAVVKDAPDNSSVFFDVLTRFENTDDYQDIRNRWDMGNYPLLAQVDPAVSQTALEKSMIPVSRKYYAEVLEDLKKEGAVKDKDGQMLRLKTIPLKDFHLNPFSNFNNGLNPFYPWLMLILAIMIIAIACINFINLSIARSLTRGSEIGLRKALGAMDRQLMIQFWSEAFLLCLVSLMLGVILTVCLLPVYNASFNHQLSLGLFSNIRLLASLTAGFFLVTLMAGGYPAWRVARSNIVEVLKGKLKLSKGNNVRNGLIIVQFIVAAVLISCTAITWQQLKFVQAAPLGYNVTQVISIPVENAPQQALTAMRNKMKELPEVESMTAGMLNLGMGKDGNMGRWKRGFTYKDRNVKTQCLIVDYDYVKTLDLKVLEGRDFSREFGTDSTGVVINEQMARQLGEKDPVGAQLNLDEHNRFHVIGVVKDYHFESLRKKVDALMMMIKSPENLSYIFVKVNTPNATASLKKIEGIWQGLNPLARNNASFLDENANRMYKQEQRFSKIFLSGALLAILISCMGLFAIAVLVMTQRQKEIGVRKVLGASVSNIVVLLSKDFMKLVVVAVLLATPLSWYLMQQWLNGFEFHVSIHWWMFVAVGLLAITIAFITTSLQSIRAALANPVDSLKRD